MARAAHAGIATSGRIVALVLCGVELLGLVALGWAPATVLLVLLADDLWCAAGTWLRTGWARTAAGEGVAERAIAIGGHALLDLVTVGALAVSVLLMLPEGGLARLDLAGIGMGVGAGAVIALATLAAAFRRDRAGGLPDIDTIRRGSRVLTRFLLFAAACAAVLPWTSVDGAPTPFAATTLVLLRTCWIAALDRADLVQDVPPSRPGAAPSRPTKDRRG
ncbi:MAG: hypothetical protein ACK59R_15305 [Pseudomonadota bacterium]